MIDDSMATQNPHFDKNENTFGNKIQLNTTTGGAIGD